MNITDIQIVPVNGDDRLRAYVTITIDSCFVIRDLKIISGQEGLFVAMPAKKMKDGSFKDIAHPLNQSTREKIENLIIQKYQSLVQTQKEERHLKAIS